MADLDDFFAKKDRKKSKGKKFATAFEIAKKLEETGKRSEKLKKDKLQSSQGGGQEVDDQGNTIQDEDEWKDFEEEKKDYTGLKIQNLTLGQEDGDGTNSGDEDGGLEENESGEMVPKKKQGPWRVVPVEEGEQQEVGMEDAGNERPPPVQQQQQQQVLQQAQQVGGVSEAPKKEGIYVPPALAKRQSAGASLSSPHNRSLQMSRFKGKMKTAPDVRNEELFPSLSAAKTQDPTKKKREEMTSGGFEEVRNSKSHTARVDPNQMRESSRLALGNKFTALDHDES